MITCEFEKKKFRPGPAWDQFYHTLDSSSCLPELERHKHSKFEKIFSNSGEQTYIKEISFKLIVAPNIANSYLLFKILWTIDYLR